MQFIPLENKNNVIQQVLLRTNPCIILITVVKKVAYRDKFLLVIQGQLHALCPKLYSALREYTLPDAISGQDWLHDWGGLVLPQSKGSPLHPEQHKLVHRVLNAINPSTAVCTAKPDGNR